MNKAFIYHVSMAVRELEYALEECCKDYSDEHRADESDCDSAKEAMFILMGLL